MALSRQSVNIPEWTGGPRWALGGLKGEPYVSFALIIGAFGGDFTQALQTLTAANVLPISCKERQHRMSCTMHFNVHQLPRHALPPGAGFPKSSESGDDDAVD